MAATDGILDHVRLLRVNSLDELDAFRRWLGEQRRDVLCVDTESGGLNPHRHRHRLTQIGDLWTGWAFGPQWFGAANEVISRYTGRLGFFNSSYDWRVLQHQDGVAPRWAATDDAQLVCHIADSLRVGKLKPRAVIEIDSRAGRGDKIMHDGMKANRWTWDTVPSDWEPYWMYGALDPVLTAHLLAKLLPDVRSSYSASYDLELATARICAGMMSAGMMIDIPYIHARLAEIEAWLAQATARLRAEYNLTSCESNEQVGRALVAAGVGPLLTTPTGQPKIDKPSMQMYALMFPHAAELISTIQWVRKGQKVTGSYLGKFLELADGDIMHYSIHTCQARTGRQSVTDPPMQTYDRDLPIIRGSYIPRPGHALISMDADQIEARIVACDSGDPQMIADFREADATGGSFFLTMASRIYREQISKKDPRYTMTKNATYGQFYGAGLDTAAATAGVSIEAMRPAYDGLRQMYPRVGVLMDQMVRQNRVKGRRPHVTTMITGRKLMVDRGKEYAGVDYRVQGTAAEILKAATVKLDAAGYGPYLRLLVHDEFLAEVPAEHAQEALADMIRIATDTETLPLPITWSGSVLTERWVKT